MSIFPFVYLVLFALWRSGVLHHLKSWDMYIEIWLRAGRYKIPAWVSTIRVGRIYRTRNTHLSPREQSWSLWCFQGDFVLLCFYIFFIFVWETSLYTQCFLSRKKRKGGDFGSYIFFRYMEFFFQTSFLNKLDILFTRLFDVPS